MLTILGRVSNASFTIFLSFIMSYMMLIGLALFWADGLAWLVERAKEVEALIVQPDIPARYRVWIDLLIEEGAILLLFFTMISRIILAIFFTGLTAAVPAPLKGKG